MHFGTSTRTATAPSWRASSPVVAAARSRAAMPVTPPTSSASPRTPGSCRVKVGVADGGVDVSQVIAAIDWVVQHRNDNGMNIRVLNLSYGTDSPQSYLVDPLAFAVEQAWKAGIFVVTATGNAGYAFKTGTLTNPAYDPKIFAVGASDSMGTATQGDDIVAAYSSTGSNGRTPDVVAPGAHIVSLRVPGSYIDQNYGSTGYVSSTLFRGSGTSEAAAFVSGAAALAIQQHPSITPAALKRLFQLNTTGLAVSSLKQGSGEIDLFKMLGATVYAPPTQWKTIDWSTGIGSLELSRGTDHLTRDGVVLSGNQDIFGHAFDSAPMAILEAAGNSWSGRNTGTATPGPATPGAGTRGPATAGAATRGRAIPGPGTQLVRQQLERELVVRQQLVGNSLVRELLVQQLAGWVSPGPEIQRSLRISVAVGVGSLDRTPFQR